MARSAPADCTCHAAKCRNRLRWCFRLQQLRLPARRGCGGPRLQQNSRQQRPVLRQLAHRANSEIKLRLPWGCPPGTSVSAGHERVPRATSMHASTIAKPTDPTFEAMDQLLKLRSDF